MFSWENLACAAETCTFAYVTKPFNVSFPAYNLLYYHHKMIAGWAHTTLNDEQGFHNKIHIIIAGLTHILPSFGEL